MVVDYLRDCYRRPMRMVMGSGTTFLVRWYFAAPTAKLLPHSSVFGSRVWDYLEDDLSVMGEADRSLRFDSGRNRGFAGLRFTGQTQWYKSGIPPSAFAAGIPAQLCTRPTLWARGGVELGGQALAPADLRAEGGVELDGSATFGLPIDFEASGGVELNGSATFGQAVDFEASGGIELQGDMAVIIGP